MPGKHVNIQFLKMTHTVAYIRQLTVPNFIASKHGTGKKLS